jgi:hypothetical protein
MYYASAILQSMRDDYPKNQLDFERRFTDDAACLEYLVNLRWPEGVACPHCHSPKLWGSGKVLQCPECGRQLSVLAGTIFQDTHLPLIVWFRAMLPIQCNNDNHIYN